MERILEYKISADLSGATIKYFLKSKGYSSRNLIELKSYPEGILLNGKPAEMHSLRQRPKGGEI